MGIFKYFRRQKSDTAAVAKDRLQVIIAHERRKEGADYLPKMQHEILEVIKKYINIDIDKVQVQLENLDDCSVLELNIVLPD